MQQLEVYGPGGSLEDLRLGLGSQGFRSVALWDLEFSGDL